MGIEAAKVSHPRAQLFAVLRAYIRYGVQNPALYRLMFGGYLSGPDEGRPAIERAAAETARALLAGIIRDGALGKPIPDTPRNERKIAGAILACWSLVHGLTQLIADGLVGPGKKSDEVCETLLQGMLEGLTAKCPVLPLGIWVGPQVQ
jgi:AcrR family transcriptional regulator